MNPVTNTPDAVLAETAEPVDALDALLRQIVNGYFVLTDGQGAVSKWSEPAELLFDQPSEDILGQGFFESLIGDALPPEGHAWRGFLATGETPRAPGTVQLTGRRSDGDIFPLEAVFVPVKLDEGFDFSLFLEDLSFELPMNLMLLRMRQQHPVVVRALRQALEPEAQPWEGWRTAGTLVVFRPLSATPWVEAELARREAERAAADAETEERLTNTDPGIQGGVNDLDDAAAVVARLLSALERIDELERVAGGLPAQLEESRREADQQSAALRSDVQRALSAVPSELDRHEQDAALKKAEAAAERLNARIDQLERDRAQAATLADARIAEAVAGAEARAVEAIAESARRADAARAALESRLDGVDVSVQLEQVRAEHEEAAQAARVELATTIERLERDREREREAARAELAVGAGAHRPGPARRRRRARAALERHRRARRGRRRRPPPPGRAPARDRGAARPRRGDGRPRGRGRRAARQRRPARGARRAPVHGDRDRRSPSCATSSPHNEASNAEVDALREAVARHEAAAGEIARCARPSSAALRRRGPTERPWRPARRRSPRCATRSRRAVRRPAVAADVAALREAVTALEQRPSPTGPAARGRSPRSSSARRRRRRASLREADRALEQRPVADIELRCATRSPRSSSARSPTSTRCATRSPRSNSARSSTTPPRLRLCVTPSPPPPTLVLTSPRCARPSPATRPRPSSSPACARRSPPSLRPPTSPSCAGRCPSSRPAPPASSSSSPNCASQVTQTEIAAVRAAEQAAVERQVQTMVGDTQRQIAALHARLAVLADTGREVAELKQRLDAVAGRDESPSFAPALDRLARDEDLDALRDRVDHLPGRDELAALAGRDEVDALRERVDHLVGRDELSGLAGRDEVDALHERLDHLARPRRSSSRLASRDDVDALRERLDGLAAATS